MLSAHSLTIHNLPQLLLDRKFYLKSTYLASAIPARPQQLNLSFAWNPPIQSLSIIEKPSKGLNLWKCFLTIKTLRKLLLSSNLSFWKELKKIDIVLLASLDIRIESWWNDFFSISFCKKRKRKLRKCSLLIRGQVYPLMKRFIQVLISIQKFQKIKSCLRNSMKPQKYED